MRKIILVGASSVGLALARAMIREAERVQADAFAQKIIVAELHQLTGGAVERAPVPAPFVPLSPSYYGTGRKGKGEKARARSAMRGKGWK